MGNVKDLEYVTHALSNEIHSRNWIVKYSLLCVYDLLFQGIWTPYSLKFSYTYNFGYINIIVSLNPWGKTYYHSKNIYLCSITENVFLIKIEHIFGIFVYDNGNEWKMNVLFSVMMRRATLHLNHVSSNCLFFRWNVLLIYLFLNWTS